MSRKKTKTSQTEKTPLPNRRFHLEVNRIGKVTEVGILGVNEITGLSETEISIACENLRIRVTGQKLLVDCFGEKQVSVHGSVENVRFETNATRR